MHIPDGYLSPQTFVPLYAVMIPIWAVAARKVHRTLRTRQIPLLAIGASFSFVVMMINLPAPGGTTGHAVGAAIVSILLGPWEACLAISLTLVIQALLFGDGGITALAANSFNMAVIMPFLAFFSYRLISGSSPLTSRRHVIAGFISGYVALNAAALYTAVMFGLQPLIASAPDGHPLFAPYPLAVAVPAMALPHLFLFGIIEGIMTAFVIRYLQKADPGMLALRWKALDPSIGTMQKLYLAIGAVAIVSPLGIALSRSFKAGAAWGEWGLDELKRLLGVVPAGIGQYAELWRAPFGDYTFAPTPPEGVSGSLSYMISAALGVAVIFFCVRMWGRLLPDRDGK